MIYLYLFAYFYSLICIHYFMCGSLDLSLDLGSWDALYALSVKTCWNIKTNIYSAFCIKVICTQKHKLKVSFRTICNHVGFLTATDKRTKYSLQVSCYYLLWIIRHWDLLLWVSKICCTDTGDNIFSWHNQGGVVMSLRWSFLGVTVHWNHFIPNRLWLAEKV